MKPDYFILTAKNYESLADKVNAITKEGYVPTGGVAVDNLTYLQAMYLPPEYEQPKIQRYLDEHTGVEFDVNDIVGELDIAGQGVVYEVDINGSMRLFPKSQLKEI